LCHRETKTPGSDAALPLPGIYVTALKFQRPNNRQAGSFWRENSGKVAAWSSPAATERHSSPELQPQVRSPVPEGESALYQALRHAPHLRSPARRFRCPSQGRHADTATQQDRHHDADLHGRFRRHHPRSATEAWGAACRAVTAALSCCTTIKKTGSKI